jgi:mannose/cellobiose epimerase-like protein (N-acyl-D-glucosamine 2-epimerase family)
VKRRDFLAGPAAAGALLAADSGKPAAQQSGRTIGPLASLSLKQLRDQFRKDLFDDFLPFMDRFVIDRQYGGFLCDTGYDGTRGDEKKTAWYEGRGIWVYSFLYKHLAHEPRYLEVARKSLAFILKNEPSGDVLWAKGFSRDGRPIAPPDREVYGDLFIAEGLTAYAAATGELSHLDHAKRLLRKCVRVYDRPDYYPQIGRTYLGPDAPLFPGARIQGVWMVLVRLATQMLELRADPEVEKLGDRCLDAILRYHYNPEFGLNNELLNHDLSRPRNLYSQLVYTGHAIETLWMVLDEAVRRKDKLLFQTAAERFRRHVEVAMDRVYGGIFRDLKDVSQNIFTMDKVLWAQEEVLTGALLVIEHTGAQWAKDLFDEMHRYVRSKYPLKAHGSPLWMYQSDRKVTFEAFAKSPKRVENYHHPRHIMISLLAVERMIHRDGGVSNLFA